MAKKWLLPAVLGVLLLAAYFRFYRLGSVPLGYAWDEMAISYNGWSIAWWHRDENAVKMPLVFRSFGDYKPPLLIYLLAGVDVLLGPHLISIRVVSALAGLGIVLLTGLTANEVVARLSAIGVKKRRMLIVAVMLIMALMPWTIQFSRVGFEQNFTFFLVLLGMYGLIKGLDKPVFLWLGAGALSLSLYAFHTAKIFTPVILLVYGITFWKNIRAQKQVWLAAGLFGILSLPVVITSITQAGLSRATTLILFDSSGHMQNIVEIGLNFSSNLWAMLQPRFWVGGMDAIGIRHLVPGHGVLYVSQLILTLLGCWYFIQYEKKLGMFVGLWFVAGLLPSLLANPAPHALRSLFAAAPIAVMSVGGMWAIWKWLPKPVRLSGILVTLLLLAVETGGYWQAYLTVYPKASAETFAFGYQEVLGWLDSHNSNNKHIVMTTAYGQPYIYVLWYEHITPQDYQFGSLNRFSFRPIQLDTEAINQILLGTPEEISPSDPRVKALVTIPGSDTIAWVIAET